MVHNSSKSTRHTKVSEREREHGISHKNVLDKTMKRIRSGVKNKLFLRNKVNTKTKEAGNK